MERLRGAMAADDTMPGRVAEAPIGGPTAEELRRDEEARARERAMRERLASGTSHVPSARRGPSWSAALREDEESRPISLGWKASLLLNLVLLTGPLGLVIALPPLLECRAREARFGFFTGETLGNCTARGIEGRLRRLDDRIKMLVRGSGR
ncbi:hypothetical protein [Methylobacterium sp. J-068]|uniref:hypothetical protein n=1 Tax=Methylobacterium sp. J-068 TaxID=2836649 RepID=UPI001FBBFBF5|nr:hypothetical protein [Methylobacterium sp. J-068]MCJ2033639.1 hypothetical protein [Methylobacterium sp. J-068]